MDDRPVLDQRGGGGQISGAPQTRHVEPLHKRGVARRIELADVEYAAASCFNRQRKKTGKRGVARSHEHGVRCGAQRFDDVCDALARCSAVVGIEMRDLGGFGGVERREVDGLQDESRRAHLFLEIGIDARNDHRHLAAPASLLHLRLRVEPRPRMKGAEAQTRERVSALARVSRAAWTTTGPGRPRSSWTSISRRRRRSAEPGACKRPSDREAGLA